VLALKNAGFTVVIGGNGRSGLLLQQRFPELKFIPAPFHEIKIRAGLPAWASVMLQLPAMILELTKEQKFVRSVVEKENVSVIISDNRYGLYSSKVKSVLITHQLRVMQPTLLKPFQVFSTWLIKRLTKRFSEIWVPDFSGKENLSGLLSHGVGHQDKIRYIGPLSRFCEKDRANAIIPNKIVVIISGPDPARQTLVDYFVKEAVKSSMLITIVGGQPEKETADSIGPVTLYSHLNDESFAWEVTTAEYVIASGGYSTIMDLVSLGCRATLIPFKGQTEQEYLAARLHNNGFFSTVNHNKVDLSQITTWGLSNRRNNQPKNQVEKGTELQNAVNELL